MKKVLYVFDDINYESGAQKVTLFQISQLSKCFSISILTLTKPSNHILENYKDVKFMDYEIWEKTSYLNKSLKNILSDSSISRPIKYKRLQYSIMNRLHLQKSWIKKLITKDIENKILEFDTVIVVSEASQLREYIGYIKGPRKIQWIHTDYLLWSQFSSWTKNITLNDSRIYNNYDTIVTLSKKNREGFISKHPKLEKKTVVIPNMIDVESILIGAKQKTNVVFNSQYINIVTIGRLDKEKALYRILEICKKATLEGYKIRWYIVGDGPEKESFQNDITISGLEDTIILLGRIENPYPILRQANLYVLLSRYEGVPVSINEAIVLGVPVIATNVGGIEEQLNYGEFGEIIENKDEFISSCFFYAINKLLYRDVVYKENLAIRNKRIFNQIKALLLEGENE